ncbi:MAG: hypothetical protein MUO52_07665 [Desulfobacterales bacterium]|nr:hypothetical protein [Desulfobacterales bacterium]
MDKRLRELRNIFNPHDFDRTMRPFVRCGYAIRKVMEGIQDLALPHEHQTLDCP